MARDQLHWHALSFASFVEGVVRCSFLRANLKWQPGVKALSMTHIIPLPGCLHRFLQECVLRFSQDDGLKFSKGLLSDAPFKEAVEQRQADLASLCLKLASTDEAPAFDDPTRLPIAADDVLGLLREKGVLGETVIRVPRTGHDAGELKCALSEQQVMEAWHDGRTFAMGCAGGSSDDVEELRGLSQREFVEVLARCALHKYAAVRAMQPAERFVAMVGNVMMHPDNYDGCVDVGRRKMVLRQL